jgi:hypothetical protein
MISEAAFQQHFGARSRSADVNRLAFFSPDQSPYDMLLAEPSRTRRIRTWIGDMSLIGFGWALLVGLVMYPEAQIVGIAASGLALLFGRKR